MKAVRFRPAPGFHDLHHSYAAWQVDAEPPVDALELRDLMGHTSIRTTYDLYGHMLEARRSRQHDRMARAMRSGRGTYVAREGLTVIEGGS